MANEQTEWTTATGLNRKMFEEFTAYAASDNSVDNRNRAIALGFEQEGVLIAPGCIIRIPRENVGPNTFLGLYSYISGDVTIGKNVLIGPHCSMSSNNHRFNPETESFVGRNEREPIVIRDGCWLAAGVMVTAGVTVGKANLVCANSVVTKSTPDYAIVAGTPAKQVGRIDPGTGEYEWF